MRVAERQHVLVVVIDGLDEDEGAAAGSGKPSIASLLPKRPSDAVRVLVTSRPYPGVPGDVPADHPLRHCRPRSLTRSPFAHDLEVGAKRELLEQLHAREAQPPALPGAGGHFASTQRINRKDTDHDRSREIPRPDPRTLARSRYEETARWERHGDKDDPTLGYFLIEGDTVTLCFRNKVRFHDEEEYQLRRLAPG